MRRIKFIISGVAVLAVVLGYLTPATSITEQVKAVVNQNKQIPEAPKANIDEEALAILKKTTDYLTGLKQFSLKAVETMDVVQNSGQKIQFSSILEVIIQRPNRLFGSWIRDDGSTRQVWYNRETVTIYEDRENVYGQIPVPHTIDEMLDYLETVIKSPQPLADLFNNELSHLTELALSGRYVGMSYLDGIACDHLAFRGEAADWQLWIDRGEKPFIRKTVITYKELPGEPQFIARIVKWDIQPNLSDDMFRFSPPEGARQIQFVILERGNAEEGGTQ